MRFRYSSKDTFFLTGVFGLEQLDELGVLPCPIWGPALDDDDVIADEDEDSDEVDKFAELTQKEDEDGTQLSVPLKEVVDSAGQPTLIRGYGSSVYPGLDSLVLVAQLALVSTSIASHSSSSPSE
jgi:hypothetical protein